MGTAEAQRSQETSSQGVSRWRRFPEASPRAVGNVGTVLSLGWAVMLVWIVLDLVGLT